MLFKIEILKTGNEIQKLSYFLQMFSGLMN